MYFPTNSKSYSRTKDIEKKTKRDNFYKQPDECKLDAYLDPNNSTINKNSRGITNTIQGILRVKSTTAKELFCMVRGEMFLKAFPEKMGTLEDGDNNPSLAIEVLILRYLSYFRTFRISPCVQQYYMDFTCSKNPPEKMGKIETQVYGGYKKLRERRFMYRELMDTTPDIRYVMTEFIDGKPIEKMLHILDEDDFRHLLFQVFYTCHQFYLAGVKHSDLHTANVLVKSIEPQDIYFVTPQGIVVLENCKYLAKIIDYDVASFYEKKEWTLDGVYYKYEENLCEDIGACRHGENPKFDHVTFLTYLHYHLSREHVFSPFIDTFIFSVSSEPEDMILNPQSKYKSGWNGRLCFNPRFIKNLENGDYANRGMCKNWVPSDELFRPFSYMVENNLFELKTLPFTQKSINSLPMEKTWISLEINDDAYEEMKSLRSTSPKKSPGKKTLSPKG